MNENFKKQKLPLILTASLSAFVLVLMFLNVFPFLNQVLVGTFGIALYIALFVVVGFSLFKLCGKIPRCTKSFWTITICILLVLLFMLHYIFAMNTFSLSFGDCLSQCYKNLTVSGAFASVFMYPIHLLAQPVGTIVFCIIALLILVAINIDKVYFHTHLVDGEKRKNVKHNDKLSRVKKNNIGSMEISTKVLSENNQAPSFISMPLTFNAELNSLNNELKQTPFKNTTSSFQDAVASKNCRNAQSQNSNAVFPVEEIIKPQKNFCDVIQEELLPQGLNFEEENSSQNQIFEIPNGQTIDDIISDSVVSPPAFLDEENNILAEQNTSEEQEELVEETTNNFALNQNAQQVSNFNSQSSTREERNKKLDEDIKKQNKKRKPYVRPPLDLLTTRSSIPNLSEERFEDKAHLIEQKLEEFRIPARCINVVRGPAITRFEFEMPQGISVNKVNTYANDISMVLEARKAIRIEAPIPGKNAFGIEVPNDKVDTVGLRDLVASQEFINDKSPMTFALGKDITNKNIYGNLAKLVHTLVAGSTGSGKSVCLNSILISLLYKCSPDDVRIILVDPKFVEFNIYEKLPHLLVPNIVTDPAQAVNALNWAIEEMERRNRCFRPYYVRSIDEYNDLDEVKSGQEKKMPYILIMVDELADLMMNNKREIEERVLKLAQKARSAGIHLVLATQRPSVDIITGTIKANLPSRIAFSLTNYMDSKTIIDQGGAEKLLGRGDMLYMPRDVGDPQRLLGPFISQKEVYNIVQFVKANNESDFDPEIEKAIFAHKNVSDMFNVDASSDEYFIPAVRVAIEQGQVSTSYLQRRFGVGYQRASKLMDQMEAMGYINPSDGTNKPRKVVITEEEFLEKYGDN